MRVLRPRREYLVVGAIWLLGLASLASVLVLQGRLDQRRRAQIAVVSLRMQVSTLPKIALDLNGSLTRSQVQATLGVAERGILDTAASLDGLSGNRRDSRVIDSQARRLFPLLTQANRIASAGQLRAATVMLGLALLPGAPGYRLNTTFARIGDRYGREASSARRLSELGAIVAIVALLAAFSIALARASRLARDKHLLLEQSRRDALTDDLTGLANRRRLFADLEELLRGPEPAVPVQIAVLDLDGFKAYNDRFGHPAGDVLLARMGSALRAAVGDSGAVYRLGGDEFCVIARGEGAAGVLERARAALVDRPGGLRISCSLGAARVPADGATADELLRKADERLYDQKRSSRHAFVA
jgi:diguanylate cyclase (GGDEF)-like protein